VNFNTPIGATPILDEDLLGLKINTVQTLSELNIAEESNIRKARLWSSKSRILRSHLLDWKGIRELHRQMFGEVWKWAGQNRVVQTNIGCAPEKITENTAVMLHDVKYWIENKVYPVDEITIRFHHRLVEIHPFRNGNGRHARRAAELLAAQLKGRTPTWGGDNLTSEGERRDKYLLALRNADQGNYFDLSGFSFME